MRRSGVIYLPLHRGDALSNLELMIKPASGACNMRCKYCFYADEMEHRASAIRGVMGDDALEALLQKSLHSGAKHVFFVFQGGEPTLAGLGYYQRLHERIERINTGGVKTSFALQTNGYAIDEQWADLFAKHGYLVGLSLDGPKNIHDRYRRDAAGIGTFDRAMAAAELFGQYGVEFNVLCVVTAQTAKNIQSIYAFYKKHGFSFQQYIPCLEPIGAAWGRQEHSLTPSLYAAFLKKLFDLWYEDTVNGRRVYNRTFENWIGMLMGIAPESCGMAGVCAAQHVIEADGKVYPCDFYVLDEYEIGDVREHSFEQMAQRRRDIRFIEQSAYVHPECRACRWTALCRGGCRRYREPFAMGELGKNHFCSAYRDFFEYAAERMIKIGSMYGARR